MFSLESMGFGVNNLKHEKYILTWGVFHTKFEILFVYYVKGVHIENLIKSCVDKIDIMEILAI
ncbi:hypothetical protein COE03_11645 [Bacillus thuringiensis]|nr:hypothetical protein COE03_11645 [Bacillus thuringiensis]